MLLENLYNIREFNLKCYGLWGEKSQHETRVAIRCISKRNS